MAEFLIHTGLRISQAIALTWNDLELDTRTRRVYMTRQYFQGRLTQPETRNSIRTIPLSPAMTARLGHLRADREAAVTDIVFPNSAGPTSTPTTCAHALSAPQPKRRPPARHPTHVPPHLRVAPLRAGTQPRANPSQAWLGHHDASTTLRVYVHLADCGIGDAAIFDEIGPAGWLTGFRLVPGLLLPGALPAAPCVPDRGATAHTRLWGRCCRRPRARAKSASLRRPSGADERCARKCAVLALRVLLEGLRAQDRSTRRKGAERDPLAVLRGNPLRLLPGWQHRRRQAIRMSSRRATASLGCGNRRVRTFRGSGPTGELRHEPPLNAMGVDAAKRGIGFGPTRQ